MHPTGGIPPSPNKLIDLLLRSENPGSMIKGLTDAWGSCASSKCPKRVIGSVFFLPPRGFLKELHVQQVIRRLRRR
jgi:hypothetical protein